MINELTIHQLNYLEHLEFHVKERISDELLKTPQSSKNQLAFLKTELSMISELKYNRKYSTSELTVGKEQEYTSDRHFIDSWRASYIAGPNKIKKS